MAKALVNGINLFYELQGKGPPLVLIAGYSCDSAIWQGILAPLAKHFQVLTFDNRGVGRSDCPDEPYTVDDMAADTMGLFEKLGLSQVHILGHSMGGAIAQTIAHQHPAKVSRLVLANSLVKFNHVAEAAQDALLDLHRDGVPQRRISQVIMPWLFSNEFLGEAANRDAFIELSLNNPYPISDVGRERQLGALRAFDSRGWFHEIQAPTLVIGGDADVLCPRDAVILSEGIAGARLYNFPDMGHCPSLEKPEEFMSVVLSFLEGQ